MNEDGTMARLHQLKKFAQAHNLKMITVADLVRYRINKETLVRRAVETDLPTVYGRFRAIAYENIINGDVHLAMVMGDVELRTRSWFGCIQRTLPAICLAP